MAPYELVPQGRANTGAAIVFPGTRTKPLDIQMLNLQTLERRRQERERKAAQDQKRLQKELSMLDLDTSGVLPTDVAELADYKNELVKFYADSMRAGVNPDNPQYRDEFAQKLQLQARGENLGNLMRSQKEELSALLNKLNQDKGKTYDFEKSMANYNEAINTNAEDRNEIMDQILVPKGIDVPDFVTKFMKGYKPTKLAGSAIGKRHIKQTTEKSYTDEQLNLMAIDAMETSPDYKDWVLDQFEGLSEEQQMQLNQEAAAKSNAGQPVSALELIARGPFERRNFVEQTETVKANPLYTYGARRDNATKDAQWVLQTFAGLMGQNPNLYYGQDAEGNPVTGPQLPPAALNMHSNQFIGQKIGTTQAMTDPTKTVPDQILDFMHDGESLYVKTTSTENAWRKAKALGEDSSRISPYRRVENMYAELIVPYVTANYTSSAHRAQMLEAIKEVANRDYQAWDQAGFIDHTKIYSVQDDDPLGIMNNQDKQNDDPLGIFE